MTMTNASLLFTIFLSTHVTFITAKLHCIIYHSHRPTLHCTQHRELPPIRHLCMSLFHNCFIAKVLHCVPFACLLININVCCFGDQPIYHPLISTMSSSLSWIWSNMSVSTAVATGIAVCGIICIGIAMMDENKSTSGANQRKRIGNGNSINNNNKNDIRCKPKVNVNDPSRNVFKGTHASSHTSFFPHTVLRDAYD
jgi:hypothetical protein